MTTYTGGRRGWVAHEEGARYGHARTPTPPFACAHTVLLQYMFYQANSFTGDISGWDTSSVTDMSVRAIASIHISHDTLQPRSPM